MKVTAKQTEQLYQAVGRVRGTDDEWVPITMHKQPYHTTLERLERLVATMIVFYPENEYKIEEYHAT